MKSSVLESVFFALMCGRANTILIRFVRTQVFCWVLSVHILILGFIILIVKRFLFVFLSGFHSKCTCSDINMEEEAEETKELR